MLESEAKKKWCPHARVHSLYDDHYDNVDEEPAVGCACNVTQYGQLHTCIASDCMMWKQFVHFEDEDEIEGQCGLSR